MVLLPAHKTNTEKTRRTFRFKITYKQAATQKGSRECLERVRSASGIASAMQAVLINSSLSIVNYSLCQALLTDLLIAPVHQDRLTLVGILSKQQQGMVPDRVVTGDQNSKSLCSRRISRRTGIISAASHTNNRCL